MGLHLRAVDDLVLVCIYLIAAVAVVAAVVGVAVVVGVAAVVADDVAAVAVAVVLSDGDCWFCGLYD